ncbi:hypothetical protein HUB98_12575 [Paenibacillus barcinonensis]|uniref:WYL domain-containing protein n=1 Tax=Paenibacillus barcinonensis TaxID=198119 RepID=A0ABX6Q4F2_PAEBA|nr:hypothetical protein [Paenibacillus barcinonensis]QKS57068.1 hypothetical protein HUB98_12575 [Paenibacillus barcinonensis]
MDKTNIQVAAQDGSKNACYKVCTAVERGILLQGSFYLMRRCWDTAWIEGIGDNLFTPSKFKFKLNDLRQVQV